jgi:CheY-like chemotaxis protein
MPKILIVEDQDETRKMLRMALNKHAELILEAADGASALQVAEEQKPDVILFDIVMPGDINGFQACELVRASPELKNSFVVLVSGRAEEKDFAEAQRVGANAYFVKPFRLGRLTELVDNYEKFAGTFVLEAFP